MGAVNLQQSFWLLMNTEDNLTALEQIAQDVENNNGEALLAECVFLEEKHEQRVLASFNKLRDEEYGEFIDECNKYLKELAKEISIRKFTFAELEEEEGNLDKLTSWFKKISVRDIFQAPQAALAQGKLREIEKAFDEYNELVFQHNTK